MARKYFGLIIRHPKGNKAFELTDFLLTGSRVEL